MPLERQGVSNPAFHTRKGLHVKFITSYKKEDCALIDPPHQSLLDQRLSVRKPSIKPHMPRVSRAYAPPDWLERETTEAHLWQLAQVAQSHIVECDGCIFCFQPLIPDFKSLIAPGLRSLHCLPDPKQLGWITCTPVIPQLK